MNPLKELARRLSSLVNRVVLWSIDNDHKNQMWVVKGVEEQDKEVEVLELYGLTTRPPEQQGEVARLSLEGYEDHTVAIGATGGIYRPRDAEPGEVILYTRWDRRGDESGFHRIRFEEDGEAISLTVGNKTLRLTASGLEYDGDIDVSGSYKKNGVTVL